jgi:hypothetical protein
MTYRRRHVGLKGQNLLCIISDGSNLSLSLRLETHRFGQYKLSRKASICSPEVRDLGLSRCSVIEVRLLISIRTEKMLVGCPESVGAFGVSKGPD